MFWMVVIPFGLAMFLIPGIGADRHLTIAKYLEDIFLIPCEGTMVLNPAWTLQHEFIFYGFFAVFLWNRKIGASLFLAWQIACFYILIFHVFPGDYKLPTNKLFGYHNFGFLFGVGIALLYEKTDLSRWLRGTWVLGMLGTLGVVGNFLMEWKDVGFQPDASILSISYSLYYSMILIFLLSLKNSRKPSLERTLGVLGVSSYTLYLIHEPLQSVTFKVLLNPHIRPFVTALDAYFISLTVAVAVAIFVSYRIERPVLRRLNRFFSTSHDRQRPIRVVARA